jgi:hypothetical protein
MKGEHEVGDGDGCRRLLTESDMRRLLGGVSERKFKALRAAGVVGDPLNLGPRMSRWTHADFQQAVARLPRRPAAPEPETLSQGRRARIEAAKLGAGARR